MCECDVPFSARRPRFRSPEGVETLAYVQVENDHDDDDLDNDVDRRPLNLIDLFGKLQFLVTRFYRN